MLNEDAFHTGYFHPPPTGTLGAGVLGAETQERTNKEAEEGVSIREV